jgi:hypothetical protein
VGVIERRWTLHAVNEDNRRTANAMVEGPMIGPGDAPVEVVPADQLTGAVAALEACRAQAKQHKDAYLAMREENGILRQLLAGGQ